MDKQVIDSRMFRRGSALGYLENKDRYLTDRGMPQFSYGIIGCGMMGQEHMHNALLAGHAGIGGIFDPAQRSISHALRHIAKQQPGTEPRVYDSLEQACADPDTDALIIATPNFTHLEVLRVATQYDKAILLEKPIATTTADAYAVKRPDAAAKQPSCTCSTSSTSSVIKISTLDASDCSTGTKQSTLKQLKRFLRVNLSDASITSICSNTAFRFWTRSASGTSSTITQAGYW